MSTFRWNLIIGILILSLIVLQYRLWFENGGVRDMLTLKKKLNVKIEENNQLKKRNEELVFQVERLRNSHDAVESRARNELGMVKKGETFYQVVK